MCSSLQKLRAIDEETMVQKRRKSVESRASGKVARDGWEMEREKSTHREMGRESSWLKRVNNTPRPRAYDGGGLPRLMFVFTARFVASDSQSVSRLELPPRQLRDRAKEARAMERLTFCWPAGRPSPAGACHQVCPTYRIRAPFL